MNFLPKLESFEGPLDLLLHLIEKNKIDIYDIPIADITDQYMEYLEDAGEGDIDFLSEFLVMAATLLEIKAKMLLPEDEDDETQEDPRQDLVNQLIEYKLYKYMSLELKDMELDAEKTMYRHSDIPPEISSAPVNINYDLLLEDVTLGKLTEIFQDVMARHKESENEQAKRYGKIKREQISLPGRMNDIRTLLQRKKQTDFRTLIEAQPTKSNIIVTFLAVLELMKTGEIKAVQKKDEITITL